MSVCHVCHPQSLLFFPLCNHTFILVVVLLLLLVGYLRENKRVGTVYSHRHYAGADCVVRTVRSLRKSAKNLGWESGVNPKQCGPKWGTCAFTPTDWPLAYSWWFMIVTPIKTVEKRCYQREPSNIISFPISKIVKASHICI